VFGVADVPTSVIGEHLKEQVEDRLRFYEENIQPRKNVDVMKDAIKEVRITCQYSHYCSWCVKRLLVSCLVLFH
jgi:hypothetical protein